VLISERRDARRLLVAVAAAILVHVGLFFFIPFLTSLDTAPLPDYGPIVVRLEEPEVAIEPPARVPEVKPRAPGTSAFREVGATTGTSAGAASESIVSGPPPVILLPVGSSKTTGTGEQHSGEAVLLSGQTPAGSRGSLDTRKLDTSLASAATTGTTGSGVATGRIPGTALAGPAIAWDNPGAAKGRDPRSDPQVKLSDSIRKQSLLPPEVTVVITVDADGVVSSAVMSPSSGNIEVDEACIVAVRRVSFPAAPGAAPITGRWTFRIIR
jgi:TonB family protein